MKILLADDHALIRAGARYALGHLHESVTVLEAADADEVMRLLAQHQDFDLVILDLTMPGTETMNVVRDTRARLPAIPIAVLSASESQADMRRVLEDGANGFIPKSASNEVMVRAIELIMAGGTYVPLALLHGCKQTQNKPVTVDTGLTERQLEILKRIIAGETNKEIARALSITEATVKAHVHAIYKTLNVTNRTQAMREALNRGLMET